MKNFYTKYDCTQLFVRHGRIHDNGPNRVNHLEEIKHIIPCYVHLKNMLDICRKRGDKPTANVIYESDDFKTIDFELTGNDWHWKWRFGLDIELWSLLPEIKGD